MKTKSFLFAVMLGLMAWSVQASPIPETGKGAESLRKAITRLMENPELSKLGIKEAEAEIRFIIDEYQHVQILEVITDNEDLAQLIKDRLHQKKVDAQYIEFFTKYNVKVAFSSEVL
ncbi:MAG: hypothetical protein HUU34_08195 [Saprospiraceae bacterium]|jgi:hypothetical protein|nr:hypothetical protein [Saprospiraceae bacterium]